jgi:peptide chain release factor 2
MKSGGIFDPDGIQKEIARLEKESLEPDFWSNKEHAEEVLQKIKKKKNRLEPWMELKNEYKDLNELYLLSVEESEDSMESEIIHTITDLEEKYSKARILEYLGEEHDSSSAFLTIHSGAGGTEACDWVTMLLRLYTRWAEKRRFKTKLVDFLEAEGGLKSVTVHITGDYAYGYLKGESGIHRLVRISPFDSGSRRHTSFASVFCTPEIDDDISVEINKEDLRIDTFRAAGAGGQHVNKTDSAVRITHLPTGIVVQCQNERSQHKNKAMAMKVLKSRLYQYYKKEKEKEREALEKEKKDISWGNQIRSYVFQPYTLVKDHRTKYETGNIQAVMDGEIDAFIEEYLKFTWST